MDFLYPDEKKLVERLTTPARIQDYLNTISYNFETEGETCRSPRGVIAHQCAHCLEGALFAAAVLWYHGEEPLLLDLRSTTYDLDHVVAVFKRNGYFGAISKTNHAVLRYREPIYKTLRELVLSYFHEYFLDTGVKTLREYSKPFSLKKYGPGWIIRTDDLWDIGADLDDAPHVSVLPKGMHSSTLRHADHIEISAGKLVEFEVPNKKSRRK